MLTFAVGLLLSFQIFMTLANALQLLVLVGLWLKETFDGFGPGRVLLVLRLECGWSGVYEANSRNGLERSIGCCRSEVPAVVITIYVKPMVIGSNSDPELRGSLC